MVKHLALVAAVVVVLVLLSGCGVVTYTEHEYSVAAPRLAVVVEGERAAVGGSGVAGLTPSTKHDVLNLWGEPNARLSTPAGEQWLYRRVDVWCGAAVVVIFPLIPLMLPICDESERITFEGELAVNAEIRNVQADYTYVLRP